MAETTSKEVVITRIFDVPVERVWAAWTDPELLVKWWGPKHFTSPKAVMDVRVGGTYIWGMETPDGKKTYTSGTFKEVVPNQRLVYTDAFSDENGNRVDPSTYGMPNNIFPSELLVTVTFEKLPDPPGGGALTRLTIKHELTADSTHNDFMEAGWHQMIDKLARLVEK